MNNNKINFKIFKGNEILNYDNEINTLQSNLNNKKKEFLEKAVINNKVNVVNNIKEVLFITYSADCQEINYGDSYYLIDKETLNLTFIQSANKIENDSTKVIVKNKENIELIGEFILEDIYAEKKKIKKMTSQNRKEIWLDDDVLFRMRFKSKKLEYKSLKSYIEDLVINDSTKF